MAVHLLILGERDGLRWVLENERMAFPAHRRAQLSHVRPSEDLLLYTTRGCFPTRRATADGSSDARAFMEQTWQHASRDGITALIHPETHFRRPVQPGPRTPKAEPWPGPRTAVDSF